MKAFGRIDILVNNAGIAGTERRRPGTIRSTTGTQVMRVNLDGQFYCCRAIVPLMIAQNYGRIVNIASIAGKEGNPNAVGLFGLEGRRHRADQIARQGARRAMTSRSTAITPAAAKTAIFDQMTQEHIDYMLSKIPRGRFVEVEEIAALVAFCASADCSFTTGAVFDISGGRATY